MIVDAIDFTTKERVHISEAVKGRKYVCEHCGVDMCPVQGEVRDHYYRCTGDLHKRSVCAQRGSGARKIYNADDVNPEEFFAGVLKEDQKREVWPPVDLPHGPRVVPPPGEVNPQHEQIVPCRTLIQLWNAKVFEMPFDMPISEGILADLIVKQKDFWHILEGSDTMNNRVLEVKPLKSYRKERIIVFTANWRKKIQGKYVDRQKLFLLRFTDDELYSREWKKVFDWQVRENGTYYPKRLFDTVLVAGCWRSCEAKEYRSLGLQPYDTCIGVQIADCVSSKQIYGIPETKHKKVIE